MHSARIPVKRWRWRIIRAFSPPEILFSIFIRIRQCSVFCANKTIRYTCSKFNFENIFKGIKNVEKFIRKRLNFYKVFNKIKQLEKEIFYQHTIKSQRATDVLKYPTKFTEMEKSKVARCRIGWTMDSMTRVHLYVAPVIDLFGKVFEENCTTAFAKSIPCIFYVNRPRSFYILPRNVDCRNRVVYFSIEVLLFILFFFLLQKENNNCVM